MKKLILLAIGITIILVAPPSVMADRFECAGDYSYTTFGNIVVPSGNICTLRQYNVVEGNIMVEEGANLFICPDNEVLGNIEANKPDVVFISDLIAPFEPCWGPGKALGITIGGNIHVHGANSFSLIGNPDGVTALDGNLIVNKSQYVVISNFAGIAGNVELKKNVDLVVEGSSIAGHLKIMGTTGTCVEYGNSVGKKLDTCP